MRMRRLGSLEVPALGYGAMNLSPGMYGDIDDATAAAVLRHVVGRGAALIDTSDAYGHEFHNERLIGRVLRGRTDGVVIATKFGLRPPPGAARHRIRMGLARREMAINAEPCHVRSYALASLARLGVDRIDLWYPHFPDPEVPIEDTVGAMGDQVEEGLVGHIGLSNVSAEQLRRSVCVHPIAAVQVEWSLWKPVDADLLAVANEHDVGIVAWSPLGSGFLTGAVEGLADGDFRHQFDRFAAANLATNAERYAPIREIARRLDVSAGQLALAWLLHQHERVVPIPSSRSPKHIDENLAAAGIDLTTDALRELDAALRSFDPAGRSLLDT